MKNRSSIRIVALFAVLLCQIVASSTADAQQSNQRRPQYQGSSAGRPGNAKSASNASRSNRSTSSVKPASHVIDGQVLEGDIVVDDYYGGTSSCDSCGGGGCDSCGVSSSFCGGCAAPHRFCICFPSHGWVHAEYLLWSQSGMRIPALVTTSSATSRTVAGVLGQPTTSVLYGNDEILDDAASGFRIRFGWWLASLPGWGVEGEYTGLGEQTDNFFQQSNGTPILARPFFNTITGLEDSELIAFPNVIRGSIAVDSTSKLDGAAFRFRRQMCCSSGCGFSELCCSTVPTSSRLDATFGYRFWELDESLQAREQLTSQTSTDPGTFDITDRFETRNQFNGAEVGFLWQGRRGWWSLDALMRVGIGNMHQTVNVSGSSTISDTTTTSNFDTGFLAQRTNIGTYERDTFTMIPELGLTLGYQMTKRLRATMGYSLVYMGNVVRPGDQVDLNVNPNLLAPENDPFTGALRPQFRFAETDYWVQGLSFGGEFRW